jgi:hypothetical protein
MELHRGTFWSYLTKLCQLELLLSLLLVGRQAFVRVTILAYW